MHTVGSAGLGAAAYNALHGCADAAPDQTTPYPPARTGMRGNHDGSYETAHALARYGQSDWGPVEDTAEHYDLVIVGGGISGLSAAHFFRQQMPDARILILENHDDFGGHAKRNEHTIEGQTRIDYGGSSFLVNPQGYSPIVKGLLDDIGVNLPRLKACFDTGFYKRHGLQDALHFNKAAWGKDRTIPFGGQFYKALPFAKTCGNIAQCVAQMPISPAAQAEFLKLLTLADDQMPEISAEKKIPYLRSISYRRFLEKHLNITQHEVFDVLQDMANDPGLGIEAADAHLAMAYHSLPGWDAAGLPKKTPKPFSMYRFPDGNASIARLLVRQLIPNVAPGNTMEDSITARYEYGALDDPASRVRLRLDSTVIHAAHDGPPQSAKGVRVTYVRGSKASRVTAKTCILACNNAVIPYLWDEIPKSQAQALRAQVRQPILITSVAVKNWRAWKALGIGAALSPGSYHLGVRLGYPLSLGDYQFLDDPDQPTTLTLFRFPHVNNQGLTPQQQYRAARQALLETSFEDIERHVRVQLDSLLKHGGFNAAQDITGITVNRWAHGYAYDLSSHALFDQLYDDPDDPRYAHVQGRKHLGRIAIANSDAAASAMLEAAVEQAHRAVIDLKDVWSG